jgi:hypothetical protein
MLFSIVILVLPFDFLKVLYVILVSKCKGISKMLPFFATKDFNSSPPRDFILPLYVEAQAQLFASCISPPRVRSPLLYDLVVKAFKDNEAQK